MNDSEARQADRYKRPKTEQHAKAAAILRFFVMHISFSINKNASFENLPQNNSIKERRDQKFKSL